MSGTVTVRPENVPWDQAFDVILKVHNLGFVVEMIGKMPAIALPTLPHTGFLMQPSQKNLSRKPTPSGLAPCKTSNEVIPFTLHRKKSDVIHQRMPELVQLTVDQIREQIQRRKQHEPGLTQADGKNGLTTRD